MISRQLLHRSLAIPPYLGSCRSLQIPLRLWKPCHTSIRSLSTARVLYEQKGKISTSGLSAVESNGSKLGKKNQDILVQAELSTKEQRKADWAIMKEMAKYLWPKVSHTLFSDIDGSIMLRDVKDSLGIKIRVGISLALLVGAKVGEPFLNILETF